MPLELCCAGLEAALERFADHDVLRAVLDLGSDPKEYGRQYEAQLRSAELESIQDYIAESDNLVALHGQVMPVVFESLECHMWTAG